MFGFTKKTLVTTTRETETLTSAVDVWVVEWTKRVGSFFSDTVKVFQPFTNYEEAVKFKASLDQAFKLIGTTSDSHVNLYKEKNGL